MKKTLISSILLIVAAHATAATTLSFATEATYPPFVSMNAQQKMIGFGPDVIHAVCKIMHAQCKLVNAPWDSLIPSLKLGKYDALFGGMGITKQRLKVVDFSQPYYQNASTFVINKKTPLTLTANGLKGKTIGVQGGTTFEQYIKQKYGNSVNIKTYASNMTALLDLKVGRVDAVFLDKPVATTWLQKPGNQGFASESNIMDTSFFGPGNAIAINKGNVKLKTAINKALATMQKDGSLHKLQVKWFGK